MWEESWYKWKEIHSGHPTGIHRINVPSGGVNCKWTVKIHLTCICASRLHWKSTAVFRTIATTGIFNCTTLTHSLERNFKKLRTTSVKGCKSNDYVCSYANFPLSLYHSYLLLLCMREHVLAHGKLAPTFSGECSKTNRRDQMENFHSPIYGFLFQKDGIE